MESEGAITETEEKYGNFRKEIIDDFVNKIVGLSLITASITAIIIAALEYLETHNLVLVFFPLAFAFPSISLGYIFELRHVLGGKGSSIVYSQEVSRGNAYDYARAMVDGARKRLLIAQPTPSIFFGASDPGKYKEEKFISAVLYALGQKKKEVNILYAFSLNEFHFQNTLQLSKDKSNIGNKIEEYIKQRDLKVFSIPPDNYSHTMILSDNTLALFITESKEDHGRLIFVNFKSKNLCDKIYERYEDWCDGRNIDNSITILHSILRGGSE